MTEYHRLNNLNSRNFCTGLEARSPRSSVSRAGFILTSLSVACKWWSSPFVFSWSFLCVRDIFDGHVLRYRDATNFMKWTEVREAAKHPAVDTQPPNKERQAQNAKSADVGKLSYHPGVLPTSQI
jgi:hypothetical protein